MGFRTTYEYPIIEEKQKAGKIMNDIKEWRPMIKF
jgi:hypothetical protein